MAESNVHIESISSDIPDWATEDTMQKLMESMEKLVGLTDKQKKDMESGFKDMKETGKVTRQNIKKAGAGGANIFGDATDGLKSFGKELNEGAVSMDSLEDNVKDVNKSLAKNAKRWGLIGGAFAAIGQQVGLAIGDIKETVSALRDMTDTGIMVKGGFDGLRDTMAETGMSLAEVQEITGKYARTVGNVGLRSMLDLAKSAEEGSFEFSKYGMVVAEGAEFQAKMLESQRLGGIFEVKDRRAQSMALADNIKNLTAYSRILNVSREEMQESVLEAKSRADVMRKFNSMDDKSREAASKSFDDFQTVVASLGPQAKGLGDMMTTIIADPAAVSSEAFAQLASASPEVAQAILDMRKTIEQGGEISQQEIINRLLGPLDEAAKSGKLENLAMNDAIGETVNMLGGPVLNSLRNYQQRMGELTAGGLTEAEAMEKLREEGVDKAVSAATELDQELRNLSQSIKSSRIDIFMRMFGEESARGVTAITGVVRSMADTVNWLGDASMEEVLTKIVENFDKYVLTPMGNAATALWEGIKSAFFGIIQSISLGFQDIVVKFTNTMAETWLGEKAGMETRALPSVVHQRQQEALSHAQVMQGGTAAAIDHYQQNLAQALTPEERQIAEAQLEALREVAGEMKRIRRGGPNQIKDQ